MLTELGKILNDAGFAEIVERHSDEHPATLGFRQEDGSIKRYKVVRIDNENHKIWAEPITLLTEDELVDQVTKRMKRGKNETDK